MNLNEDISRLLADADAPVDAAWEAKARKRWPWFGFATARFLRSRGAKLDPDTRRTLAEHMMLHASDRAAMIDYADIAGDDWYSIYPTEPRRQTLSTEDTISAFLDTYGSQSPEDDAMLERLIFSPAPADYFAVADDPDAPLELPKELRPQGFTLPDTPKTEEKTEEKTAEKEPATTEKPETSVTTEKSKPRPTKAPQPSEDTLLSESLAKIFIKQGLYERAFEIISNLSLKFPEKSIYFADQLRFLQKLIINRAATKQ